MKKDISIIIPLFNGEKFITRCLESLQHPTNCKIEIIIIDDGSTDNSLSICKEFSKYDKRIIIFTQQNNGAAQARNFGIKQSKANYIMFIDADDYVNCNYINLLFENINKHKSDIAFCNVKKISNGHIYDSSKHTIKKYTSLHDKLKLLRDNYFPGSYAKIINKKLIDENKIFFLQKENYHGFAEDILFSLNIIFYAKTITFCNNAIYYYTSENTYSICTNFKNEKRNNDDRLIIIDEMLKFAYSKNFTHTEILQLTKSIENHLVWGGFYTTNKFIKSITHNVSYYPLRQHFILFKNNLKKQYTFKRIIYYEFKSLILSNKFLYNTYLKIKELLHIKYKH